MDTIQVVIMGKNEARLLVEEIKSGIASVSDKLFELYNREGWRSLGYKSWPACAMAEFNFSHSHAYRLLGFAQVKQNILESPMGDSVPLPIKERQTRPLKDLSKEQQGPAWITATREAQGQPTAKQVERIVKETKPISKESQTKWQPKSKVSTGGFNQATHFDDFNQDTDSSQLPPEVQKAIGILEVLGWTCISPEAAEEPTCAYCGKAFKEAK